MTPREHLAGRPVVYDVTRLATRALQPTPNGIDRVDFALARHFLSPERGASAALVWTALGPRLVAAADAYRTLVDIEAHWNEFVDPARDPVYEQLLRALAAPAGGAHAGPIRVRRSGLHGLGENWRTLRRFALRLGDPPRAAPRGAIYVNASQFPLHLDRHSRWLDERPDVRPLFFVHDLLPLDAPEFFPRSEPRAHLAAMRNIVRRAAGVVVASRAVARRLETFAAAQGRDGLAPRVAALPVSRVFAPGPPRDPRLVGRPYFVICGTIEPRKNHLVLLNVWRDLAAASDAPPPRLIVAGKRGWRNENVLALMERGKLLRDSVIEANGLSTPALRELFAGACAVLMPSFGEGFGLPVAEAAAAGAPVVVSDIESFREIGGDAFDYLDPLDGRGWRRAVLDYSAPASPRRAEALRRLSSFSRREAADFIDEVEDFAARL